MIYQSFFALAADKAKNISRKVTIGNESEIKDLVSSDLPDNNFLFKSNNPLNPAINITGNHKRKKVFKNTKYRRSNRQTMLLQLLSPNSP